MHMKRLNFIYLAAPLTVALNAVPACLEGVWRMISAVLLGLTLWAVVWIRLYKTGKLRPEFAVITIIPPLCFYALTAAGPEYAATFKTVGWQNFNFFLWLGSIFVMIRALLPTQDEYKGKLAADSVFIFMSIITTVYGISCWANTHLFL